MRPQNNIEKNANIRDHKGENGHSSSFIMSKYANGISGIYAQKN